MVRRVSISGTTGRMKATGAYGGPVRHSRAKPKQTVFRRGEKTIKISGQKGMSALLTLANGKKINFVCRRPSPFEGQLLRVYTVGPSTRAPTAEEVKLLGPFKAMLRKRGWTFKIQS